MGRPAKTAEEVLSRHIKQPSGCWEWQGSKNQFGYGTILRTTDGKPKLIGVHRFAYTTWRGQIPDGKHVMHTCDNRGCINPDHLQVGTHADNMRDMVAKGRHSNAQKARKERLPTVDETRQTAENAHLEAVAKWLRNVA